MTSSAQGVAFIRRIFAGLRNVNFTAMSLQQIASILSDEVARYFGLSPSSTTVGLGAQASGDILGAIGLSAGGVQICNRLRNNILTSPKYLTYQLVRYRALPESIPVRNMLASRIARPRGSEGLL
jgi:hypothetical protein